MQIALIQYIVFWLNNIPKEGQDSSPREMIMGEQALDFSNLCKLPFGAYAQVHEDPQIMNTMEPRTTGGINLGPSNMTGAHKFLSLATGDIITRRKWSELPVPADVIIRLEERTNDTNNEIDEMQDDIQDEEDNQMETT